MCHVLVIEDEPLIADHVADIARAAGATTVEIAMTESEAILSARADLPAVILSDVKLKGGGTGPAAYAAIRAELGPTPVIFVTGTPEECEPCDYAAAILGKPVIHRHVVNAFRKIAP